jgi:hypothetical protein
MKFEKGQWVTCEGFYMQVMNRVSDHVYECRFAGRNGEWVDKHIGKMVSATLTPDFSNAKVGDECWHGVGGFMLVNDIYDDGKAISIKYDNSPKAKRYRGDESDLGGITTIYTYRNGYMPFRHPELFNSFTQFLAYWQEEALKLKGGSDA